MALEGLLGLNNCFYASLLDNQPLNPLQKCTAMVKCNGTFVFLSPMSSVQRKGVHIYFLRDSKTRC